jgi:hypothetical protein
MTATTTARLLHVVSVTWDDVPERASFAVVVAVIISVPYLLEIVIERRDESTEEE